MRREKARLCVYFLVEYTDAPSSKLIHSVPGSGIQLGSGASRSTITITNHLRFNVPTLSHSAGIGLLVCYFVCCFNYFVLVSFWVCLVFVFLFHLFPSVCYCCYCCCFVVFRVCFAVFVVVVVGGGGGGGGWEGG